MKSNQKTKPRRVIAMDIPALPGEGERLIQLYDSGLVKLPLAITRAIKRSKASGSFKDVGDTFRQQLDRYWAWKQLKKRNPDLSPYSLRHGFAWRAHKEGEKALPVRDCAALMGHTPIVHLQSYGRWTDEQGLEESVARHQGVKVAA